MIPLVNILIVLVATLIGLFIAKIVDSRMRDISINMPTIQLPTLNIHLDPFGTTNKITVKEGIKVSSFKPIKQTAGNPLGLPKENDPRQTSYGQFDTNEKSRVPHVSEFVPARYGSPKEEKKYTGITPEASKDHQSRPAPYPRPEQVLNTISEPIANDTLNYYLDPKDMTPEQVQKFKLKAKFEKMTVKDYTNWLMLFKDQPQKLAGFHRANLRILEKGGKLTREDLPVLKKLPTKVDHEYMEKINKGTIDNIPQPEHIGYVPYNAEQEIGTASLIDRNLRHLDFVNPDEPYKTWILTRESKKAKQIN